MKTYRVAILGCRGRGSAAARAYHAHPRTDIVALCDLEQDLLNTLGDELGVEARYTDLDAMITRHQPDIVAIPTGTEFHYPLALRVLEYGVHIDIEKPLCVDCAQADEVLAKAQEKNAQIAVHHQGRTGVWMKAVARAFAEGRIGELQHIHGHGKNYYGGYNLMNIGTHMINNMLKLAGQCRSVVASATTDGRPIVPSDVVPSPQGMGTIAGEHITATLDLDGGVSATLLQHRFPTSVNPVIEFCGSEGRLVLSQLVWKREIGALFLPQPHYALNDQRENWEVLEPVYCESYDPQSSAHPDDYAFVDEYVTALDEGREHECSGQVGHHIVEIMMGIFESAAYGRRVDLPQQDRSHPLLRWRSENGLPAPEPMPRPLAEWVVAEDARLGRAG